jgi:hypothetical protein
MNHRGAVYLEVGESKSKSDRYRYRDRNRNSIPVPILIPISISNLIQMVGGAHPTRWRNGLIFPHVNRSAVYVFRSAVAVQRILWYSAAVGGLEFWCRCQ